MKNARFSKLFQKKVQKLKGQELINVDKKKQEILKCEDINHYKNLRYHLKKYKRVHVNNSFVILFFGKNNTVYFVDYEHHDVVYEKSY